MSGLLNDGDPDDRLGYGDPMYRLGQAVTYDGQTCVVWELGPDPRTYWVIRPDRSCVLAPEAALRPAGTVIASWG